MSGTIWLRVTGIPKPGGSKTAFPHASTGRMVVIDACRGSKAWKNLVAAEARKKIPRPLKGPVYVAMTFYLPRPKVHYNKSRTALSRSAPEYPAVRPDVLKLARSTEDALTGIAWLDDSQIVDECVRKRYSDDPSAYIEIRQKDANPLDDR